MPYITQARPQKKKGLHPIWRGVGCLMIVVVFGASYWIATRLIELNQTQRWVPPKAVASLIPYYPQYTVPAAVALLVALLVYGLIVVAYGFVRGPVGDPLDVRGPAPRRRPARKIRKCR